MAQITAALVKELRERTGAGMMDCKKALTEADGDMEKAIEFLREKGLAAAEKKAGRIAAEGKALADVLEHCADRVGQVAAEERGSAAGIVGVLAGFGAHIHDLALLHDHSTLAVGNGHD